MLIEIKFKVIFIIIKKQFVTINRYFNLFT